MLVMHPQSDAATAFTITRNTSTAVNGSVALTGSQTPSANVSLGVTRTTGLTVEYAINTWTVSSHRMVGGKFSISLRI